MKIRKHPLSLVVVALATADFAFMVAAYGTFDKVPMQFMLVHFAALLAIVLMFLKIRSDERGATNASSQATVTTTENESLRTEN